MVSHSKPQASQNMSGSGKKIENMEKQTTNTSRRRSLPLLIMLLKISKLLKIVRIDVLCVLCVLCRGLLRWLHRRSCQQLQSTAELRRFLPGFVQLSGARERSIVHYLNDTGRLSTALGSRVLPGYSPKRLIDPGFLQDVKSWMNSFIKVALYIVTWLEDMI